MKVKELEKKEEEKRKEKEKIYESQFLEDIKEYQARGTIKSRLLPFGLDLFNSNKSYFVGLGGLNISIFMIYSTKIYL